MVLDLDFFRADGTVPALLQTAASTLVANRPTVGGCCH